MHDDEMMDGLLRRAMASEAPALSPGFDAAVLRRARPRRLSRLGRIVMVTYSLAAATATAWLTRGLEPVVVGVGLTIGLSMLVVGSAYARQLVSRE